MTKDSELRCRLAAVCTHNPKLYHKLAEWLEVYQYILPNNRAMLPIVTRMNSVHSTYLLWEFCSLLECCFDLEEQEFVWKLILINES